MADVEDIATDTSADCNGNGLPDDCEAALPPLGSLGSLTLPGLPVDLAVEDFTGDGVPDLAFITRADEDFSVSVFSRTQAGSLEMSWRFDSPADLLKIAAGDVDGDGDHDVILLDADGIDAHLNDGAGGFEEPYPVLSRPGVSDLELARLDPDDAVDIVATDAGEGAVLTLLNDGDGRFESITEYPQDSPGGLAVEDWDGDGDRDVAVVTAADRRPVSFFFNEGDGTLVFEGGPTLPGPFQAIVAANLDGDSLVDLAARSDSAVVVLRNVADLEFRSVVSFDVDLRDQTISALALGDLDSDADLDLVVAVGGTGAAVELQILVNRGGGEFDFTTPLSLAYAPTRMLAVDLDGDDDSELLLVSGDRDEAEILWNDGGELVLESRLSLVEETVALTDRFEPHSTIPADFDLDGDLDLATMDGEDRVMIVENDGEGGLTEGPVYRLDGASELISITASDLDGDGDADIAAVDEDTNHLLILVNEGDGTFNQLDDQYDIGYAATFVIAADLNGDGFDDVVCTNSGDDDVYVFLNRQDATFEPAIEIPVGNLPAGVAAGDFDDDGDVDLAVANLRDDNVSILFNDGDASFDEGVPYEVGGPRYIISADLDNDNDIDLAAAREGGRRVSVLLNGGDGTFTSSTAFEIGQSPRSVIALDLDGDGQLDLVTGNASQDTISILVNRGGGDFDPPLQRAVGAEPRYVVGGDLDGDGDRDVISANHDSHDFTVFFNDPAEISHLGAICTESDFDAVSTSPPDGETRHQIRRRRTRYLVPVDPDGSDSLSPLFSNAHQYASMREFLTEVVPESFAELTDEDYDRLVGLRGSREYFTGDLYRLRIDLDTVYGFDLVSSFDSELTELPTPDEVRSVHEALSAVCALTPLVYFPDAGPALDDAASWEDPGFPILFLTELFRRADVSHDGTIDQTDAVFLLEYMFLGGDAPRCERAADANDDGSIDIGDAVALLFHLFRGTVTIPEPFSRCATDPTPDDLSCREVAPCAERTLE